ncbi:hypothetical protein CDL15_Pgr011900 [Punica granatum]|uniref:Uncharacterized protein n=1 Tax=Punica granatum TaxID=22663 RepID=A0A218WC35_PUNGR|nr:hypothetical protein CDL15_Pgr011900 [Punica granatum]
MHVWGVSGWHHLPMGPIAVPHHRRVCTTGKVVAAVRHVVRCSSHPRRVGKWARHGASSMFPIMAWLVPVEGPVGRWSSLRRHVLVVWPLPEVRRFCSKIRCSSSHQPNKYN